jgi:hypothetical protein
MNVLTGEAVALARCLYEVRNHLQNGVPSGCIKPKSAEALEESPCAEICRGFGRLGGVAGQETVNQCSMCILLTNRYMAGVIFLFT